MIFLELIGWLIFFSFISFPVWINGNWKTIFDKKLNKYHRELKKEKNKVQSINYKKHICTQYQPFKLTDKEYVVCNFICDGDCQFKGTKFFI